MKGRLESRPSDPYSVRPLEEIKIGRRVRRRIRLVRRERGTGLVTHAVIHTSWRSGSSRKPVVSVKEGSRGLSRVSVSSRRTKWVNLAPGRHLLTFTGSRGGSFSRFEREFVLSRGDVLVAICLPIQPWTVFGNPKADCWYLGVVSPG